MPKKSTKKAEQKLENVSVNKAKDTNADEELWTCEKCGKEYPMEKLNRIVNVEKDHEDAQSELICVDCFISKPFRAKYVVLSINGKDCIEMPKELVDNLNKQIGGNPCVAVRWLAIRGVMEMSLKFGHKFMGEKYALARASMDQVGFDKDEIIAYEQLVMIVDQLTHKDQ